MTTGSELDFDIALERPGFHLQVAHGIAFDGITALFGQNGSGKSTLLRTLAGLERSARGWVRFNGEIWQAGDDGSFVPAYQRGVGYVFQEPRLFTHLNVAGNLGYAERRARSAAALPADRITREAVVDVLELGDLLDRPTATLSGGERQRVALGRALLARPRLMFLDEPLSAVDNRRRHEILNYIARLPALFEIPMLYVTHALDEVVRLADDMLVLSEGRLLASGPVDEILERLDLSPQTGRFEAGVVLRAIVAAHDRQYCLTRLEHRPENGPVHTFWVPAVDAPLDSEVRLRIRARDVTLASAEPQDLSTRNVIKGILAELIAEPDTAFAETLIDIGGARLRARVTRKAIDDLRLQPGDEVFALIKSISLDRIIPLA